MAARRMRICTECAAAGKEATFETGNKLRQHRRSFHPVTSAKRIHNTRVLKNYRRDALIKLIRGPT